MVRTHAELIKDLIEFGEYLYIKGNPVYLYRTPVVRGRMLKGSYVIAGRKGHPDVSGVINGIPVFFEAKAGKDKQSAAQKEKQARIESAGGQYHVYRDLKSARMIIYRLLGNAKI